MIVPAIINKGLRVFDWGFDEQIARIIEKTAPKMVLVNMIYYPDEIAGGSWADSSLCILGYNRDPEQLQVSIDAHLPHNVG
jgi:hypothetical protein